MVRLKVRLTSRNSSCKPLFQFHYGTIKRTPVLETGTTTTLFQFHYGTIKSLELIVHVQRVRQFQFHYGTIKR